MILFNDALDHLIRIYRMIRMDRGHVLLIGSSGNGKKSLSKLAAFTSGNIALELVIFLIVITTLKQVKPSSVYYVFVIQITHDCIIFFYYLSQLL